MPLVVDSLYVRREIRLFCRGRRAHAGQIGNRVVARIDVQRQRTRAVAATVEVLQGREHGGPLLKQAHDMLPYQNGVVPIEK